MLDIIIVRTIFAFTMVVTAYYFRPFGLDPILSALYGMLAAIAIILFEARLHKASLKRLIGAAVGSTLGIMGATMISGMLSKTAIEPHTLSFLEIGLFLLMGYVGLVSGANKGDLLNLAALGGLFGGDRPGKKANKILDTSVIIDGRIADVCETGFVDGILVIPQFVLRELQQVADSADSMKRNRGRRGLDILQRIQKMAGITVQIVETDFPGIREVDLKLIELAKQMEAKIITNDFNLNKVAQLQGVEVLNINELANSLKPVVLPGEIMKVFILKEGKEYNQGVAYLDDGTMVVVDNARKMIGKTIDTAVTSVLQTTAGKMIFGRYEEKPHNKVEAVNQ
ncbi:MAG: PIN domain nuclease [Terriglobia bacterium]